MEEAALKRKGSGYLIFLKICACGAKKGEIWLGLAEFKEFSPTALKRINLVYCLTKKAYSDYKDGCRN